MSDPAGGARAESGGAGVSSFLSTPHIAPVHSDKNSNAAAPESLQPVGSLQKIMKCFYFLS